MAEKIKNIKRFNQRYRSLSFSEVMSKADEEFLDLLVEMDENGNLLSESKFTDTGELEEKNTYTWNEGGKLTEHVLLYALDDVTEKRVLKRDEKNRLVEEIKYYGDDSGERTTYAYDDKDNVTGITVYDEEGDFSYREVLTYTEKGGLTERIKYDVQDKITEHLTFSPESDEKTVEEKEFHADGSLKSRTVIRFNEQGREISSVQTTPEGKLISSVTTVYDERGNVAEKHFKDFYSKSVRYSYDDKDRMTVQELYDGSGLLLRKNMYEYDDAGNVISEQTFEIDTSRGGRDKHFGHRYEYEFYSS